MKGNDERTEKRGVSRRSFLKGAGGVIGAAAVGSTAVHAAARPGEGAGAAARKGIRLYPATGATLALRVNGQAVNVEAPPSMTLLEVLREKLDLTGAKEGCGRGACGACTVLLDGRSVNSCLLLAVDAVGSEITTIEGLAKDGRLDPLQAAFVEHDACQCGYCTPGFVMRTHALLDEHPKPTMDEIKSGLSGNICRCGAYVGILRAAAQAAEGGRS